MKSAYELAMERLNQKSPSVQLTERQKRDIGELESRFKARLAEREIALKDLISQAAAKGEAAEVEQLEQQLALERRKIAEELEEKKERVRQERT